MLNVNKIEFSNVAHDAYQLTGEQPLSIASALWRGASIAVALVALVTLL